MAEVIAYHLSALRFEVRVFTDPHRALQEFKTDPNAVDILVTDYIMPGLDGLTLAGQVWKRRQELRVVCVTGHGSDLARRVRELPVRASILHKPFTLEELKAAIMKAEASVRRGGR